ncbi:MAG TPA: glucose-1-phosphate adenylyltransferase [Anaerolineaceae bacterium]|nr:glucose-1-phosphate adenylyltransferase [Anaerolineaceae bacterium]
MQTLENTLAVIMGGGQGTRLFPLTQQRAKPAVPFGGKYRLIDVPISNCINSGIYKIAVLTQFNSVSLHRHISNTYNFDAFHSGYVQIWAAEQTGKSMAWYQGTADAVRKQISEIRSARVPYVLILAGDHLYRMNYANMAAFHWEKNADVTVAVQPIARADASRFGVLKRDQGEKITRFAEKPKAEDILAEMISRPDADKPYFGSMGIYMFKTDVLCDLLEDTDYDDFGKHAIPAAVDEYQVYGYYYDGFWADIGTIRAFYEMNLALTDENPSFSLIDEGWPIYTHARFLSGTQIEKSQIEHSLLAEGGWIKEAQISHSVIGLRSQIRAGAVIKDSILMGADYYGFFRSEEEEKGIPLGIGNDCYIEGAIIDKNARIGSGTIILPFPSGTELETSSWMIRDGIVVVPKNTILSPGTRIAP